MEDNMGKGTSKSYSDTIEFLKKHSEDWVLKDCCSSNVVYGMLLALFEYIFYLAPSKEEATNVILEALNNFNKMNKS